MKCCMTTNTSAFILNSRTAGHRSRIRSLSYGWRSFDIITCWWPIYNFKKEHLHLHYQQTNENKTRSSHSRLRWRSAKFDDPRHYPKRLWEAGKWQLMVDPASRKEELHRYIRSLPEQVSACDELELMFNWVVVLVSNDSVNCAKASMAAFQFCILKL